MKVIVMSHAHPTFSKGGGELAAYYLWQEINGQDKHDAWFIGRGQPELLHKFTDLAVIGPRDYLMAGNANIADLTSTTRMDAESDFGQLLKNINPDVVHLHHYVHLGVEVIRLIKNVCPKAKIVLTLHEYIAICQNNGQMVKTDGRLCHQYSPRECHLCFPHVSQEDIFLRERYIKSFFDLVDAFISPSEFLKQRYVNWGLIPERITVIENGIPEGNLVPPRSLAEDGVRGRFAYFGQINPYKGIDVVLEAFAHLKKETRKKVTLDIFGSALTNQTVEFQQKISALLNKTKTISKLHGAYEPHEMERLVAEVDWIIMGSVWWENSPLIIQEAFKFGRPVIVPDIGGMAEKVKPSLGGLNYRARDSVALANTIERCVTDPNLFELCLKNTPGYSRVSDSTKRQLELYSRL